MYLSESDLNKIGQDIISTYTDEIFSPVNIEVLLKNCLDISVEDYTLHPSGQILGMCSNHSHIVKVKQDDEVILAELNKHVVFIDSSLNSPNQIGRRNFTIAHEGSHHFLFNIEEKGGSFVHHFCRTVSRSRFFDPNEWRADVLASCLLLPEDHVRYAFFMFFSTEHIERISPFDRDNYSRFTDMSIFFQVSKTALAIRLKKLGLINEFSFNKSLDVFKS